MVVENSGDNLTWAKSAARANRAERATRLLELLPLARAARCTSEAEIGCHEADAILRAVRASQLIGRCSHILKVTGRYAVFGVHAALRSCPRGWDVAVQNTGWGGRNGAVKGTMVFGFRTALSESLFGWSQAGGQVCQECHVHQWLRQHPEARVCQLPGLRVKPVVEGSTGSIRSDVR